MSASWSRHFGTPQSRLTAWLYKSFQNRGWPCWSNEVLHRLRRSFPLVQGTRMSDHWLNAIKAAPSHNHQKLSHFAKQNALPRFWGVRTSENEKLNSRTSNEIRTSYFICSYMGQNASGTFFIAQKNISPRSTRAKVEKNGDFYYFLG